MDLKEVLIDLLERGFAEQDTLIAKLTPAERSAEGTLQQWSPRDMVAHVTEWNRRLYERMSHPELEKKDVMPPEDVDKVNADIFEQYRKTTWQEITTLSQGLCAKYHQYVQSCSESDLCDSQRFVWSDGKPVWRWILGNTSIHPLGHYSQFYAQRGDKAYANQLLETASSLLLPVSDTKEWRAMIIYNLACFYSIVDDKVKAINQLTEALRLDPTLTEWSKKDPDLIPLRDEPAYKALYSD